MTFSGREALPHVRECSGSPPVCPVAVGSPFRMSGSCRKTPRMSGNGRDALQDVREWSRGPPGSPGVVRMPFRRSGSGR